VFEHLVILVVHPLWIWRTTSCKNGKFDAFRNVRGVVFGKERICQGNLNPLKVWFVTHLPVADAVDSNTLDVYADGMLNSWRGFVIVREKLIGDVSEVDHVKVLARGLIDA